MDWLCRNTRGVRRRRHNHKAWEMFGQKRAADYAILPGDSQPAATLLCSKICGLRSALRCGFTERLFAAIAFLWGAGRLSSRRLALRNFLDSAMSRENAFRATE